MPFNVLRSTDVGAPQLSAVAGSLITVLDACLVNGYGSKTPLGFTKAYAATNIGVYRGNGGSGEILRVDDSFGITTSNVHGLSSASSATDISSLWSSSSNSAVIIKPDTLGVLPLNWIIVGDEYGFVLLTNRISNGNLWCLTYFGRITKYDSSGDDVTLLLLTQSISSGTPYTNNLISPIHPSCIVKTSSASIKLGLSQEANTPLIVPEQFASNYNDFSLDSTFGAGLVTTKMQVYSNTYTEHPPYGVIRGLRYVMTNRRYTDFLFNVASLNGAGADTGKTFIPFAMGANDAYNFFLIQTSAWE